VNPKAGLLDPIGRSPSLLRQDKFGDGERSAVFIVGARLYKRGSAESCPIVEVFRKHEAQWHVAVFRPEPGDRIGGPVDGIDLSTPFLLVNGKTVPQPLVYQATLTNPDGILEVRALRTDRDDCSRLQLERNAVWHGAARVPADVLRNPGPIRVSQRSSRP
jgi:hypothetical protein